MDTINNLPTRPLTPINLNKVFLVILVSSIVLGTTTGLSLGSSGQRIKTASEPPGSSPPDTAQQDSKTFRDFAVGILKKRPVPKNPNEYVEGTHILIRESAMPVALTSSVVDLNQYEGRQVKVFGETQKALQEGWLMDVGKVEAED